MQALHVINLEKYIPSYTDRAWAWVKVYCRDSYDRKSGKTFRSFLDDPVIETLDEVSRYRFISLILREAYIGRPVPLDPKNLNIMGWDEKVCPKSKTLRVLHKLIETVTQKPLLCDPDGDGAKTEKRKDGDGDGAEKERPDGSFSEFLLPDFPNRFASDSIRSLIVPKTKGDQTTLLRVAEWTQGQIRDHGADGPTIARSVLEIAGRARAGHRPIALFQDLLQRELGYPVKS